MPAIIHSSWKKTIVGAAESAPTLGVIFYSLIAGLARSLFVIQISRSNSLMPTLLRVFASTFFTITAQYSE